MAQASAATPVTPVPAVPAPPVYAHGMWIWRTQFHLEHGDGAALLTTCRTAGVLELYLAVESRFLADARLPPLVATLRRGGIRVDALIGDATWYQPEKRQNMFATIDEIAAYGKRVTDPMSRFVGVHFDIEPHQLPQNKGVRTYLPALADTLRAGRDRAGAFGLDAAADLPRFVIEDAPQLHHAFANAVPRLFLMLYELRDKSAPALVQTAASVVESEYRNEGAGAMVVGVSVDDYADVAANLRALDAAKPGGSHYGGWAIHDEARYDRRLQSKGH